MDAEDWRVDSLRIRNFRHLEDLRVDFGDQVTLLVGMNGSGKSTVLDALAIMLSTVVSEMGPDSRAFTHADVRRVFRDLPSVRRRATADAQYPVLGEISATVAGVPSVWERRITSPNGRTTRGDIRVRNRARDLMARAAELREPDAREIVLPVIAHYGVERLIGTRRARGSIPDSRSGAYASALDPRSDLTRLASFLESLDGQILAAQAYEDDAPEAAIQQFRAIDRACASVLEPVGWKRLRWNRAIDALTLSHPDYGTLPFASLASGTKIAAGLAIDLASRMARANPQLGADDLLGRTPGIVLIDEVDLHLHPSWQQQIVPALRRTFPRIQFILSTHSSHVIATVETENIRVLDDHGVRVPRFAHGLRPEAVLYEVQGTDPKPQVAIRDELAQYLELVYADRGATSGAKLLRAKIEEELGGIEQNPELIDADAYLTFSALDDEP